MSMDGLLRDRAIRRAGPAFNKVDFNKAVIHRSAFSALQIHKKHGVRRYPWRFSYYHPKPPVINFYQFLPRILMDRDHMGEARWEEAKRIPDAARWEKMSNGKRVTEDRWALVEEDGEMHKVNWKLYSQRVETELQEAYDAVPQFRYHVTGLPIHSKFIEAPAAVANNLSMRESLAQMKLDNRKSRFVIGRVLELAQQGAEAKGLDKEKMRVVNVDPERGKSDRAIDLRSMGYYAWKHMKSSKAKVVLAEDPEMSLPDRTTLPYASVIALRKAGIQTAADTEIIDVPAITAEGI